ncbi:MAG: exodeoxyribonuclease V subunit beta [Acidithiobacillus sp.]
MSFDPLQVPLCGTQLIEASAGTGKTWTVAMLYLRLLLEQQRRPEQILVLTFTRAATAELRERIRRRLVEALAVARGGEAPADFPAVLRSAVQEAGAQAILQSALAGFDGAAIFTIHAFCQRVLQDHALEAMAPLAVDLVADDGELREALAAEFYRREIAEASPAWSAWLAHRRLDPAALLAPLRRLLGRAQAKLLAPADPGDAAAEEQRFVAAMEAAQTLWRQDGAARLRDLLAPLAAAEDFKGNMWNAEKFAGWQRELDAYLDTPMPALQDPRLPDGGVRRLAHSGLKKALKKGCSVPPQPLPLALDELVQAAEALAERYERRLSWLSLRLLAHLQEALPAAKALRAERSFDDVLLALRDALRREPTGPALAAALRQQYPAALIDEFQDTDAAQYQIFRAIYAAGEGPVFYVGDPKQAIYRFRDADIFAYLSAARTADGRHTLTQNFRSAPGLVRGVNALFGRAERPFLLEQIQFQPVQATAGRGEEAHFPGLSAPWRCALLPKAEGAAKKAGAEQAIARHLAAEVVELLQWGRAGRAKLHGQAVAGRHIAVLVQKHEQGRLIQESLRAAGVASARQGQDSVFASAEAEDLERILLAIAEPGNGGRLRAALATPLWGKDARDLEDMRLNDTLETAIWERVDAYRRRWERDGCMAMFRQWLQGEQVMGRMLLWSDGERRLTNLLHLAELLHQEEQAQGLGREALLRWFARQRQAPAGSEEHLLRLESDADLVQILTIHSAKGLQFPIVFCPFLWSDEPGRKDAGPVICHDPDDPLTLLADFGSPRQEALRQIAREEEAAERRRLLYVALTRAQYRLVLHLPEGLGQQSPLAGLLGGGGKDFSWRAALEGLAAAAGDAVALIPLEACADALRWTGSTAPQNARAASFTRHLSMGWRVGSFTALSGGGRGERPDHDDAAPAPDPLSGPGPVAFPRGAQAGICLHSILQRWNPQRGEEDLLVHIDAALQRYGFAGQWRQDLRQWLPAVAATPLWQGGPALAEIPRAARLAEWEFTFPVSRLDPRALAAHLQAAGLPWQGSEENLRGYLRGFVDLLFVHEGRYYLVDYKSNDLGPQEAYGASGLAAAMNAGGYHLQYLLYTLAVQRFLRSRLPDYDYDRHFGGVYYLFLRGMSPHYRPGWGIYATRPGAALLTELEQMMEGRS